MRLNLSPKELRTLVDFAAVLDSIFMVEGEFSTSKKTVPHKAMIQKILSLAHESQLTDLVTLDEEGESFFPTEKCLGEFAEPLMEEFTAESFWEELIQRLGTRDFSEQMTEKSIQEMPEEELFMRLQECVSKYSTEMFEHGLSRLKIIEP
ncbi:MAG TPA: hypothetical protein PKH07_03635 [bacterium]|nr:hypothetical protein [bacterium]